MTVKVGLGLPICDSRTLLTWARRADAGPFASVGLLDRLVYDNPETLIALAGVAAVTSRVRLLTEVLIGPPSNQVTPIVPTPTSSAPQVTASSEVVTSRWPSPRAGHSSGCCRVARSR